MFLSIQFKVYYTYNSIYNQGIYYFFQFNRILLIKKIKRLYEKLIIKLTNSIKRISSNSKNIFVSFIKSLFYKTS